MAFPEVSDIPPGSQDDVPIVRLVVETGANLVTTDQALVDDLNSCGVQENTRSRYFPRNKPWPVCQPSDGEPAHGQVLGPLIYN